MWMLLYLLLVLNVVGIAILCVILRRVNEVEMNQHFLFRATEQLRAALDGLTGGASAPVKPPPPPPYIAPPPPPAPVSECIPAPDPASAPATGFHTAIDADGDLPEHDDQRP
jgi:hypothetical protein